MSYRCSRRYSLTTAYKLKKTGWRLTFNTEYGYEWSRQLCMHEAGEHTWAFSRLAKLIAHRRYNGADTITFNFCCWRLNDRELQSKTVLCNSTWEGVCYYIIFWDKHIEIYINTHTVSSSHARAEHTLLGQRARVHTSASIRSYAMLKNKLLLIIIHIEGV